MPTVGDRTFGYEPRDIAAAEQYAAETGMDITYEEEGEDYKPVVDSMYAKIKKTSTASPYKMKGHPLKGIKQRKK